MFKPSRRNAILNFFYEDEAATAIEYAVMLALIVAVCMASVTFLATKTQDSFNSSGAAISGAWGN
jgi:pilus assembly protein Flp/PilA